CIFLTARTTTGIYTLSLHDALPISVAENLVALVPRQRSEQQRREALVYRLFPQLRELRNRIAGLLSGGERQMLALASAIVCAPRDRKSTRLNSSHRTISYAVFCLKK